VHWGLVYTGEKAGGKQIDDNEMPEVVDGT
jgi:hypothetical protein